MNAVGTVGAREALRQSIGRLRRSLKTAVVLEGVTYVLAILAAVLFAAVAADYLLRPGVAGRAIIALVAAGIVIERFIRGVLAPLTVSLSDAHMARIVELKNPEAGSDVLSALQLRPDEEAFSPSLVEAATNRAADFAGKATVVDRRITRSAARNGLVLGAMVAVALVMNAVSPYGTSTLATGLRRLVQPWDGGIRWPQRTQIKLVAEYGNRTSEAGVPLKVARGDTVRLVALEKGKLTRSARLYYRIEGFDPQNRLMDRETPEKFSLAIPNIIGNAEFQANAGDGESEKLRLTAVDRPRVKKIQVTVTPPPYAGVEYPPAGESGQIRALKGSVARVLVDANKDLQSCTAVLQKAGRVITDTRQISPRRFVLNMIVGEDDLYVVKMIDTDGFESAQPEEYEVQAIQDRPPQVKVLEPDHDGSMLPSGAVTLKLEAKDDYGIRDIFVHMTVNNAETPQHMLRLKGLEKSPRYFLQESWAFDLSRVRPALNPGDRITLQVFAWDGREDITAEIRKRIRDLAPDVSETVRKLASQRTAVVDAQCQKLVADPAAAEKIVGSVLQEKASALARQIAETKDAARKKELRVELGEMVGSGSEAARKPAAEIEKFLEGEYQKLLAADPKNVSIMADASLPGKLPPARASVLTELLDRVNLKRVIGSGVGVSEMRKMEMINREQLAALIAEQQTALSVMVEDAAGLQGKNAERANMVAGEAAKTPALEGFPALVYDCQITQENVETKITGSREKYTDLVKTVVQNGLDTAAARKRMASVSETFADLLDKRFPAIRSSLQDAKLTVPSNRSALMKGSVLLQTEAIKRMNDIVAKLRGWSDMEKLILRARRIVDMQQAAQSATDWLAKDYPGIAVDAMDGKGKERLAAAASAQKSTQTETEMLEDDLAKIAEKVKHSEPTMYLRVKEVLSLSRQEQLVDKMSRCGELLARNQCTSAASIQKDVLKVLQRMVQMLEAAVDPTKYDIAERGDNELLLPEDAIFSRLEKTLKPLLAEQREVLQLTKEMNPDTERTTRVHLLKQQDASDRQDKIEKKVGEARTELLEVKPDEKPHNVVVMPLVLSELGETMKVIVGRLKKDDAGLETQEMEQECIRIMQDLLSALQRESIVLDKSAVAEPVVGGIDGKILLGALEDVRMLQLMQVAVNVVTLRLDRQRQGQKVFAKLPEMARSKIQQLGDRQLVLADLSKKVGGLTQGAGPTAVQIPLPTAQMQDVGDRIRGGSTGEDVQKQQENIVATLQKIVQTVISAMLGVSTLPDEMRTAAGGETPDGATDVTKPSPDLTHLLPGLKGKKSLEEMLLEMKKLEAWAKFTATEMEQIRMGWKGEYGGKYGELVKRYYLTLAGAGARAKETPAAPAPNKEKP